MRTLVALACLAACLVGCSGPNDPVYRFGAQGARLGESRRLLGWNVSVLNLRGDDDYVLMDVDAAPTDPRRRTPNPRKCPVPR
jgi:hypothetical protein